MEGGMPKKRKSGNEFRKEKVARQREKAAQNLPKITSFYVLQPNSSAAANDTENVDCEHHARTLVTQDNTQNDSLFKKNEVLNLDHDNDKYFKKPSQTDSDIMSFFQYHPVQRDKSSKRLPFSENIFSVDIDGEIFKRNWLTYNTSNRKLFCTICLVFTDGSSVFCQGFDRYRHLTQTVEEHEVSVAHRDSVKAKIAYDNGSTIDKLVYEKQLEKREKDVLDRRQVVSAVINVIKLIGKQGLAYRASEESACSLDDPSLNHGNFLEIILLLCNYDSNLDKHVKKVTEMSKATLKSADVNSKARGRGSQITFLSKTTINKIMNIIKSLIQINIANEVKEARSYSVLMDTTTDVSGFDQCVIVLRYVLETEVKERIIGLKCVQSSTGESLFTAFIEMLNSTGLDINNCIANSFDGAANMSGQYKGVSARLQEQVPNHIHTWCYAHSLNLVMTDTAQSVTASISFFGLLQQTQVFIRDSHKRLDIYLEQNPSFRLGAIGATRWRSKSDATSKIFGRYNNWMKLACDEGKQAKTVYIELVISLSIVANSQGFSPKTRNEANSLLQKFLSFETILTAMMFLLIFKSTTPLSDYLQTKNLNYAQAWNLISSAQDSLKNARNKFPDILNAAKNFVKFMTNVLIRKVKETPSLDEYCNNINIESELPAKRQKKIKKMPDETSDEVEETSFSGEESFKVNVFYVVVDQINHSIATRFSDQNRFYQDLSCFDPRRFSELKTHGIPEQALEKICSLIPTIDRGKLLEELESFVEQWPSINLSLKDHYQDPKKTQDEEDFHIYSSSASDDECEQAIMCSDSDKKPCQSCVKCAYKLIYEYNMYCIMYPQLNKAYKYLLTIPLTQVSCERAFSKLKLVKSRIRSSMSNDNLEALLLMQSERELLTVINNETIINELCCQSQEMKRLLSF